MLHNENRYVTASGRRYVTAGYSKTDYLRKRERERERERERVRERERERERERNWEKQLYIGVMLLLVLSSYITPVYDTNVTLESVIICSYLSVT